MCCRKEEGKEDLAGVRVIFTKLRTSHCTESPTNQCCSLHSRAGRHLLLPLLPYRPFPPLRFTSLRLPPPHSFDVFSSALRSSVVSVVPSSHPLTPLCISTHTPSGFDAGYRLLLHYGWLLFSRRPFRHPTLLSLLLSSTHFSSRAPPLSVFHLGYPLVHVVMVQ